MPSRSKSTTRGRLGAGVEPAAAEGAGSAASRGARPWAETWNVTSSTARVALQVERVLAAVQLVEIGLERRRRDRPGRHGHAHGVLLAPVARVHRARADRLAGAPRAVALERRDRGLPRAPRRARATALSVASAALRMCVRTTSARGAVMHMPQAENTPESGGTITLRTSSSAPSAAPCMPPPPPPTSRAKSRGSRPRCTETSFSALIMFASASRMMPLASAATLVAERLAERSAAPRARARVAPPAGRRGSTRARARRPRASRR